LEEVTSFRRVAGAALDLHPALDDERAVAGAPVGRAGRRRQVRPSEDLRHHRSAKRESRDKKAMADRGWQDAVTSVLPAQDQPYAVEGGEIHYFEPGRRLPLH
jgi:hypothetical protein